MPFSPDYLIDGDFSRPNPVGPVRLQYPFLGNKDRVSALFEQEYWQEMARWSPGDLSTPHSPALADFYLVAETEPENFAANLYKFKRTYSRIPTPQVTYSTIPINKPLFPTANYAGAWLDSIVAGATANIWCPVITSTSISTRWPTGGTFTVTYKTSTTGPLAFDASSVTIDAAINALADLVTDSTTVLNCINTIPTAGYLNILRATGAGSMTNMSITISSITPSSVQSSSKAEDHAAFYVSPAVISVTKNGHGLVTNDQVRWSTLTTGGGTLATVTRTDDNIFTIPNGTPSDPPNPIYYRTLLRTYTPGADRVRTRNTTTFYLPGISAGITTPADIPCPDVALSDSIFLTLIATAAAGFQVYDANPLAIYMGQIHQQTVIEIDMANL